MPTKLKSARGPITLSRISLAGATVDSDNHVIRGVSIIQKGPALGHGFEVDDVMLAQVYKAMSGKPKGVKSRLTHPGMSDCGGYDGIEVTLGRIRATGIDGDKVRGDAYLGDFATKTPAGDIRSYVEAISAEDPELLGISVVFDPDEFEDQDPDPNTGDDRPQLGRVKDVLAADFVGDPAANRDGLLSRLPMRVLSSLPPDIVERWSADFAAALAGKLHGGAVPPSPTLHVPNKETNMNPKLKSFLIGLGLAASASDEQAQAFYGALNPETKLRADAAAKVDATTPPPAPAGSVANVGAVVPPAGQPATPPALSAAQERRQQLEQLAKAGEMPKEWVELHALDDAPLADLKSEVVTKLQGKLKPLSVHVGDDQNLSTLSAGIRDALVLANGKELYETDNMGRIVTHRLADGTLEPKRRQAHPRALECRYMSLLDMAKMCLEVDGVSTRGLSKPEVAKLAFNRHAIVGQTGNVRLYSSTADFPNILADTINKEVGVMYQLAPDTTTEWTRSRPIPDFKQASVVRLSAAPKLTQVTPGADYEFYSFDDEGEKYTLAKYGYIIGFNWETLINDDKAVFVSAPQSMGLAARSLKVDLVYNVLTANPNMADGVALFHANHGNLQASGAGSALSQTSWAVCEQAMVKQTSKGQLVNARPKFMLIPYVLRQAGATVIYPSAIISNKSSLVTTTANPYADDQIRIIPEARLDISSGTAWYAASNPNLVETVEVGYLEGEPEPVVTQEDAFSYDGRKIKVRFTAAAKAANYRGLYKSPGA